MALRRILRDVHAVEVLPAAAFLVQAGASLLLEAPVLVGPAALVVAFDIAQVALHWRQEGSRHGGRVTRLALVRRGPERSKRGHRIDRAAVLLSLRTACKRCTCFSRDPGRRRTARNRIARRGRRCRKIEQHLRVSRERRVARRRAFRTRLGRRHRLVADVGNVVARIVPSAVLEARRVLARARVELPRLKLDLPRVVQHVRARD